MGVLFDYFAAGSDGEAAATIDLAAGPGGVAVKGIDPVVQLATLEELLTGRPYDEVSDDPRNGHAVAIRGEGEMLVLTITDALTAALAQADTEVLRAVAVPWAATEEFWGAADPEDLAEVLGDLAVLARQARASDQNLYCWVSV